MPEGDTIHRTARTLHRALAGQTVTAFDTQLAGLAVVDRRAPVTGRRVERVEARGKHLLIVLSGDLALRSHMRMHGSWHIYRPGERWRAPRRDARIVLGTAGWVAIAFGVFDAELLTMPEVERHGRLSALGPDLLGDAPDMDHARARVRASGAPDIAAALLVQQAVAGIGNVYKSELLFLERLFPFTPVADVTDEQIDALLGRARKLLELNVAESSSPGFHSSGRVTTGRLNPRERLWVYGRAGAACFRCGAVVQTTSETGGRRTYWCPRCQPAPGEADGRRSSASH
jgi:endonuclease-8